MTDDAQQPEDDAAGENTGQGFDDMSEYLQVYLDESDEELDALVDTLLKLEENPADGVALDEGFRLLHTLKGSAGMMGFEGISALAHQLESRFEDFRSGDEQLDRPMMSFLLRCIDFLREFNGKLRAGKSPDHNTSGLVAELLALTGAGELKSPPAAESSPALAPTEEHAAAGSSTVVTLAKSAGIHVIVRFEPGLQLADLKARLIVARLSNIGEIVGTEPPIDDVESFEDLPQFALVLVTDRDRDEVREIANVDGVAEIEIEEHRPDDVDLKKTVTKAAPSKPQPQTMAVVETPGQPAAVENVVERRAAAGTPSGPADATARSSVSETVRVDIVRLDDLMNLTGELVVTKARFVQLTTELGPMFKRNGAGLRDVDSIERLRARFQKMRTFFEGKEGASHRWTRVLDELNAELDEMEVDSGAWEDGRHRFLQIAEAVDQLSRISDNLQQSVLDTRMVSVGPLFNRFRRVIRDLAVDRHKKVQLVIRGETTELDKRMIDELGDPLIHLVRNAIDHGLESAETRQKAGKPETGTVELEASHSGNSVFISIRDDGAGIPVERVRQRLIDRNLLDAETAQQLSDQQVVDYIWRPGFSTAESVTDVSGRGVGMDVVRNRIADLNGTIDVDSQTGVGTTFTIRLPLTLAIIRSLMVRVYGECFSIPVDDIREIVEVPNEQLLSLHGLRTIDVRGEFIPVITLEDVFDWWRPPVSRPGDEAAGCDDERDEAGVRSVPIVILQFGEARLGLCVDELYGGTDIVIKSLADNFVSIRGLSGASVMADGAVCLMLDTNAIIHLATRRSRVTEHEEPKA